MGLEVTLVSSIKDIQEENLKLHKNELRIASNLSTIGMYALY